MRMRPPLVASFLLALCLPFAIAQAPAAATLAPAAATLAPVAQQAPTGLTKEQLDAIAARAFEVFRPKGMALAVVKDDALLTEIAFGERKDGQPATPRSLFNIASCSKAFTAALVAQQVSAGKLRWNDRVVDHVPEFRMQDPWITARMTVADLLSHRCGLVTFAGDLLWYGSDYTDAEVLARIEKLPIKQSFREEFGYQNLMYMVAGIVLERTTGRSWEQLVEEQLMQPLGMSDTRASVQRLPEGAERAFPHIDGAMVEDHAFVACKPAASIYSSVHDLSHWIRALLASGTLGETKVLEPAELAEMWHPRVSIRRGPADPLNFMGYGLGWFVSYERGRKVIEHDGGMPGFLSKVSLVPAEHLGFVVLNNSNDGVLNEAIKQAIYAALDGKDPFAQIERLGKINERITARTKQEIARREAQRVADTAPTLPLKAYVGRYVDATYGPAEVTLDGETLKVELIPSKRRLFGPMAHWHHDVFRVDFPDRFLPFALFRFEFDSEGGITGFRIDCPIADFDFGALQFDKVQPKK